MSSASQQQLERLHELTRGVLPFCLQRLNRLTGEIDVLIVRPGVHTARYIIDRDGNSRPKCHLTIERRREGFALLHDGDLVCGATNPVAFFHYVATLNQGGPA